MDVHQFHPQPAYGDAVSNQVLSLQRLLRGKGYRSEIFCEHDPFLFEGSTQPMAHYARHASPENVLLLHFGVRYSTEVMAWLDSIPDRKVLVYHNITPHTYFAGVDGPLFEAAKRGREQLDQLRALTEAGWGVSTYNCRELAARGWTNPGVLPIVFDPKRYAIRPDRKVLERCRDGRPTILFVGRVAPNKCFEDLILTFFYLKRDVCPGARLVLVGAQGRMVRYVSFLQTLVDELGVSDVVFTGHISNAELVAYYRCASLYLSMSEHEGFGVPLLESMHFGLPIVAYAAAAVPETLQECGVLVTEKDHLAIAELVGLLIEDEDLRTRLIAGQRRRLEDFLPESVEGQLRTLLAGLAAR
jgi:glycosyltransferase involved in cell wall biosynthesis